MSLRTSEKSLMKILVVDDVPANLVAMRAALSDSGYEIVEASSGAEALIQAELNDFAVILLDVQMPELDGFETASLLRAKAKTEATPIIFATAIHQTERHEQMGYVAGAVDYLFKPINVEILKAKISVFVEMQRKNELLREAAIREHDLRLLKDAVHARDEFLSVASHELRSPLTPLTLHLQTFMELFENNQEDQVPREKLLKMLATSLHQVARLTALVSELIDVSRIKHGNLVLNLAPVNLLEVIQSAATTLERDLNLAACTLAVDVDSRIYGYWDRFRLEQILVNLLENACKYGKGAPIEISGHHSDQHIEITVKDRGVGIAKEDQERIFDRFERAASTRNFGGLGLGLYISSQLVKLHKGEISVESSPGKGAEFKVRLPETVQPISA